jgi:hypothetical protein
LIGLNRIFPRLALLPRLLDDVVSVVSPAACTTFKNSAAFTVAVAVAAGVVVAGVVVAGVVVAGVVVAGVVVAGVAGATVVVAGAGVLTLGTTNGVASASMTG